MGRRRKFRMGDVAYGTKPIEGVPFGIDEMQYFGVIVNYRRDPRGKGMYHVVRTLHPVSGATYGPPMWVSPEKLTATGVRNRWMAKRVYKANNRLVERGCSCMCCAHEAIPNGMIRADGSFTWIHEPQT